MEKCAEYMVDSHIIKMPLESAQILSTVCRKSGLQVGYKATHQNHPCVLWAGRSLSNWRYLKELTKAMNQEYRLRYNKKVDHKSFLVAEGLPEPVIPDIGLTEFALAMPEECKIVGNQIQSYRRYYMEHKQHLFRWKNRMVPWWIK